MSHSIPQRQMPPFEQPILTYRISGRPGPLDRPALAPGHPVSWGLLTEGTILEGAAYPHPVFIN